MDEEVQKIRLKQLIIMGKIKGSIDIFKGLIDGGLLKLTSKEQMEEPGFFRND